MKPMIMIIWPVSSSYHDITIIICINSMQNRFFFSSWLIQLAYVCEQKLPRYFVWQITCDINIHSDLSFIAWIQVYLAIPPQRSKACISEKSPRLSRSSEEVESHDYEWKEKQQALYLHHFFLPIKSSRLLFDFSQAPISVSFDFIMWREGQGLLGAVKVR